MTKGDVIATAGVIVGILAFGWGISGVLTIIDDQSASEDVTKNSVENRITKVCLDGVLYWKHTEYSRSALAPYIDKETKDYVLCSNY